MLSAVTRRGEVVVEGHDVAARYAAPVTGLNDAVWRLRGFFTVLDGNYPNRTHLRLAAPMAHIVASKVPTPRRAAQGEGQLRIEIEVELPSDFSAELVGIIAKM